MFGNVQEMFRKCSGTFPEQFPICPDIFRCFPRYLSENVPEMLQICFAMFPDFCPILFPKYLRMFSGFCSQMFGTCSGNVMEKFYMLSGICPVSFCAYAHMEIVVVLIVVKFGGFLVITRDHGSFGGRHQVEILPTGLPELFKPARDLLEPRKC